MLGRPKAELALTDAEQEQLTALTLRCKTAQALVICCHETVPTSVVVFRGTPL